jgi:hypothetical protein
MANLSTTDARQLFTTELVATFSDRVKPKSFLRSFFKEVESNTKSISIEVERDAQSVAVDVIRGTEGNRNTWDTSTEKLFVPPYYNEYFDVTELACYEDLYVNPTISSATFGRFLKSVGGKMEGIMDKVDRAYELQASQVLLDGVVQLKNGINIDFKRKAGSLIAYGAGNDWSIGTVDPNTIILQGCTFLKETGKMEGSVVNLILGSLAYSNYLNNPFVKARALAMQYGLDSIVPAQRNALGQSFHGEISVGAYRVRLWSYPEVYKHPVTGVQTAYMHTKKIVMLPEVTANILSYAAVPQLLSTGVAPKKGKFLAYEYLDERATSHIMGVKSAGVCIPVGVDQLFTAQVLS